MAISIYLNGKKEEIEQGLSISKILEARKIRPEVVTVEVNEHIIERSKYPQTLLKPQDRVEFVYYMGGGGLTQPPSAVSLTIIIRNRRKICLFQKE